MRIHCAIHPMTRVHDSRGAYSRPALKQQRGVARCERGFLQSALPIDTITMYMLKLQQRLIYDLRG